VGYRNVSHPSCWPLEASAPPYSIEDRRRWARFLDVSEAAVELVVSNDVVDLHVDSFIWRRLLGYELRRWHAVGLLNARWLGQADLPRLRAAGVTGAHWVITTNPFRTRRSRLRALRSNYATLCDELTRPEANAAVVRTADEYRSARAAGKHAAFLAIQGGNALSDPESSRVFPLDKLFRVTLVHLTHSDIGDSSFRVFPGKDAGLRARGRELVHELERHHVLVDLAHASSRTFWDVVECHDRHRPLVVSHTGFSAITPHWRNLSDEQARAIAHSGGLVGVLFHGPFLGDGPFGGSARSVAKHIAHGIALLGAKHIGIGSDWDGLIATPLDMPTCLELPRLVQALLDEGISQQDIVQVLGRSFLEFLDADCRVR
jgi:membrane dipeptidase